MTIPPGVEIRHLRAFVAVARELHFTRAAESLHLVQQALSMRIQQLETALGAPLFDRTTRSVKLTAAGEALLPHVVAMLDRLEAAVSAVQRSDQAATTQLRLVRTPSMAPDVLPSMLEEMHRDFPDLQVTTEETLFTSSGVSAVVDGKADVAFVRYPHLSESSITATTVQRDRLGVILGAGHRYASRDRVSLADMARNQLAIWTRDLSPGFYDAIMEAFARNVLDGNVGEYERFSTGGFLADPYARSEVAANRAFVATFAWRMRPLPREFVWVPLEPAVLMDLHLVYRPQDGGSLLRAFVQLARRCYASGSDRDFSVET